MGNSTARIFSLAMVLVSLSGCGNQNQNGYYLSNGSCFSNNNGQPVNPSLCGQNAAPGNGFCYGANGQIVSSGTCGTGFNNNQFAQPNFNNGFGPTQNTAGLTPISCVGTYSSTPLNGVGAQQPISCNGANCSGYTLYNQSGIAVLCQ